jgi:hypothetical protein
MELSGVGQRDVIIVSLFCLSRMLITDCWEALGVTRVNCGLPDERELRITTRGLRRRD